MKEKVSRLGNVLNAVADRLTSSIQVKNLKNKIKHGYRTDRYALSSAQVASTKLHRNFTKQRQLSPQRPNKPKKPINVLRLVNT